VELEEDGQTENKWIQSTFLELILVVKREKKIVISISVSFTCLTGVVVMDELAGKFQRQKKGHWSILNGNRLKLCLEVKFHSNVVGKVVVVVKNANIRRGLWSVYSKASEWEK